jgi:HlyD family secretion protein
VSRAWVLAASAAGSVVAAVAAVAWFGRSPAVPTARVSRGPFVVRLACEGTLRAAKATPIGVPTEVDGPVKIGWIAADGSRVKAGDVVVRFDPTDFEVALQRGRSQHATSDLKISRAKAEAGAVRRGLELDAGMAAREVDNARTFAVRDAEIYSRFEIIDSEIDATLAAARQEHADAVRATKEQVAESDLALLGIERRKADLDITQAERGLAAIQVRTPHDGILVLQRDGWGNVPRVGDTVWRGYRFAEIPRLDRMEAEVFVLEADAGGLAVGQNAEIVLDARPGVTFAARVLQVDTLARPRLRGSPLQFFGAVLEIPRPDGAMKPGERVRATLTLAERKSALVVPRQAVFQRDGRTVVYREKRWGGFEPRDVRLGATALGRVVVEAGLGEDDVVALADPARAVTAAPDRSPAPGRGGT